MVGYLNFQHVGNKVKNVDTLSQLYFTGIFLSNRECSRLFGEDGMTLKVFVKRTAPFSILWTLTSYLYLLALKKLTATDVSALYCCHKAFVFLLSWIVLKDRFMGVRVCFKEYFEY